MQNEYWEKRKESLYYQVSSKLATRLSRGASSVLDVGSAGAPILEWFPKTMEKTSVDLRVPYQADGVISITADFLKWEASKKYDLVVCMQVLEHVRDAKAFAQKLLSIGRVVLVSVPYKWPHGRTKSHIHDPVDEQKMFDWFGYQPNFEYVCREVTASVERLIHVYDWVDGPWASVNDRNKLIRSSRS